MAWKSSIEFLLMSRPQHSVSISFNMLFLMSRHQSSCRDITLCCCRLHWLFLMSRLQIFCRDITSLISAPSSAAYAVIPVVTCCICFFNFLEVATSKTGLCRPQSCINDSSVAVISASIIDCIFYPLITAFSFFLSLFLLMTNW